MNGQKVLFAREERLAYKHNALLKPLWEVARPAAEQVAKQMLYRLPDCEANVQDVLARVHYALTRFRMPEAEQDHPGHLIAFSRRVAHDACVDLLRNFSRKSCVAFSLMPEGWDEILGGSDPADQILDQVNASACAHQVARLLSKIPLRQAMAWLLHLDSDVAQEVYQAMQNLCVSKRYVRRLSLMPSMLERAPLSDHEIAAWLQVTEKAVRQLRWRAKAYLAKHFHVI